MDFKFNFNQTVKVKLTSKGEEVIKKKHKDYDEKIKSKGFNLESFSNFELKIDDEGYYETQLWSLMRDFGEYMHLLDRDNVFNGDMIFVNAIPLS